METLYRKFIQEWMETQEPDTFLKDEHGRVMYTAGGTTINLVHYFEELLEDFAEKLEAEKKELLEILMQLCDLKHIKDLDGKTPYYLEQQPLAWTKAKSLIQKHKQ